MLNLVRCGAWSCAQVTRFPGKWRLLQWLAAQPLALQQLAPKLIDLDGGSRLLLEAFNNRGHYLEPDTLSKDDQVVRAVKALVAPGHCVVDVGANIGRITVLASRQVGPMGRVVAFEPSPKVISSLYRNLEINRCANVTVHNVAVTDLDGALTFNMPLGTNSGWGSLRELATGAAVRIEVSGRRLDSLLAGLPPVRLLKVDVEGADLRVIRGAQALLRRDLPAVVLEYSPAWIRELGDDPAWLLSFFKDLGYATYQLTDAVPQPLTEVPNIQVDLLALPPGMPLRDSLIAAFHRKYRPGDA